LLRLGALPFASGQVAKRLRQAHLLSGGGRACAGGRSPRWRPWADQVLGERGGRCRAVETASDDEAAKRQWRRLEVLVNLIAPRHGREPIRSATTIRLVGCAGWQWTTPAGPAARALKLGSVATPPASGDSRGEAWVATVLHAMRGRLHGCWRSDRILRGHISPI